MRASRRIIVGALAGITVLVLVAHESILMAIGDFLVISDTLKPADVIHVVSGADYRTDYAVRLYNQHLGRQIFFTGGWCVYHGYYHGEHGSERARAYGVELQSIAFDESPVTSTYAEASRLKEFTELSGTPAVRSVIVISDPYHMRRVRWTYRKVLGDQVAIELAPVPFVMTPYQRRWWEDPASRQYVQSEYIKLVYYFARYQLGWTWLARFDRE